MTRRNVGTAVSDPIYGDIVLDGEVASLAAAPVVQRLRHVRLSNIDSLDMPGISGISRFEHSLGVAYLAQRTGLYKSMERLDRLALEASALLHDWSITAFGHLVEEAYRYVGTSFDHQERLYEIVAAEHPMEVGGVERQLFGGRESGIRKWIHETVGRESSDDFLRGLVEHLRGYGRFGGLIAGTIDLDNIDNVFRIAWHMGLTVDREIPISLARSVVGIHEGGAGGEPVFRRDARYPIEQWLRLRSAVYERLMLAERDFSAKLMILYATILSFEAGDILEIDWNLTDSELLNRLKNSSTEQAREIINRWEVGELWYTTPLHWFAGQRPDFTQLYSFSRALSGEIDRSCFAYGIKDKRERKLFVRLEDESVWEVGESAGKWVLGVGSVARKAFRGEEIDRTLRLAETFFSTTDLGPAVPGVTSMREEPSSQLCFL